MRLFLLLLIMVAPLTAWGEPQPFIVHKGLSGESIRSIAARYGAPSGDVASANGLADEDRALAEGTVVLVPKSPEQTLATLYEAKRRGLGGWPKPRYADSFLAPLLPSPDEGEPLQASSAPSQLQDPQGETITGGAYTVQPGDTLYRIAKNALVPLADLLKANDLTESSVIHGGDLLTIPGRDGDKPLEAAGTAETPREEPAKGEGARPSPEPREGGEKEGKGVGGQKAETAPSFKARTPLKTNGVEGGWKARGSGLFQKAPPGAAVYAPASGTVLHGGWMKEYDNAVFIRHESDFATFCGGLGIIYVKPGQTVTTDTKIGLISDRADSGLWFQVLRGGKSVDPSDWLEDESAR